VWKVIVPEEFNRQSPVDPSAGELLVSVRSERELEMIITAGVDIIDIKEPLDGPLAPGSVKLWKSAAECVTAISGERPRLSAALGEADQALNAAAHLPVEFDFAKAGPSGTATVDRLRLRWDQLRCTLGEVELVAVAYADHELARCINPVDIFQAAAESGFRHCLLDTYVKDGTSSPMHLGVGGLKRLAAIAQTCGLWWALAGSIRWKEAQALRAAGIKPDCYAVRGDVCHVDRCGELSLQRLARWVSRVRTPIC